MKPKKIVLFFVVSWLGMAQSQAEAVGDTLVIEEAGRVRIETRDTVQRIVITGMKDDPQFHYVQRISIADTGDVRRRIFSVRDFNKVTVQRRSGRQSKLDLSLHLHAGLGTMTGAPSGYDFKLWPSTEIGLSLHAEWHPLGPHNVWSAGLGYSFANYRMANDTYLKKGADGRMGLAPYDASTMSDRRTQLSVFSVQVPLLYTHRFDARGRTAVTLGAIVNLNTGAKAVRSYVLAGEHYQVEQKHIGQRPVTVDGLAMLKLPSLPAIYCRYCPMTFFKDAAGPTMHQLSFGIFL